MNSFVEELSIAFRVNFSLAFPRRTCATNRRATTYRLISTLRRGCKKGEENHDVPGRR